MANIPLLRSREEDEFAGSSTCPLLLTTMAGTEIQIVVPFSIHHNWEMLEDYLVEHLPGISATQSITPLKGSIFYCYDCFRQLDNSERLTVSPRLPIDGMEPRFHLDMSASCKREKGFSREDTRVVDWYPDSFRKSFIHVSLQLLFTTTRPEAVSHH